jgi:peptidoglycan-N-acetylglucosamine deacetylase
MLTYRTTLWVFIIIILIAVAVSIKVKGMFWIPMMLTMIYIALTVWGSANIRSGFFIRAICKGYDAGNKIALTFDDGPVAFGTENILDTLKEHNVQAAFFCIGNRMRQNPDLLRRIVDEGHLIGNHSYSHHVLFDLFPFRKIKNELSETNRAAEEITGLKLRYFRPPYGVTTPVLAKVIQSLGFNTIGWNVRSFDTVIRDRDKLLHKVTSSVRGGDIILLHDTSETTASSLKEMINTIREKGYSFVRLDQLIGEKAYA